MLDMTTIKPGDRVRVVTGHAVLPTGSLHLVRVVVTAGLDQKGNATSGVILDGDRPTLWDASRFALFTHGNGHLARQRTQCPPEEAEDHEEWLDEEEDEEPYEDEEEENPE